MSLLCFVLTLGLSLVMQLNEERLLLVLGLGFFLAQQWASSRIAVIKSAVSAVGLNKKTPYKPLHAVGVWKLVQNS